MIVCEKCGKDNQDHYKFCLGCGAELSRKDAPKPFTVRTPPQGVKASVPAPAQPRGGAPRPASTPHAAPAPTQPSAAPPPAAAPVPVAPFPAMPPGGMAPTPAAAPVSDGDVTDCPQCGNRNPTRNRFCASCGYNLGALMGQHRPAAAPAAAAAPAQAEFGVMLVALRADGSEAARHQLPGGPTISIGRESGPIFASDSYLSPRHATMMRRGHEVWVRDEGSLNGVYLKMRPQEPWAMEFGDVFRIGQEIIRYEQLRPMPPTADGVQRLGSPSQGYIGRLALVIGRDTTGNAFPIPERGVTCGRERGDILFPEDGYVSGLHCRIFRSPEGQVYLMDVGSSNGTFMRLRAEHVVKSGDILLMGQQLFRVDY